MMPSIETGKNGCGKRPPLRRWETKVQGQGLPRWVVLRQPRLLVRRWTFVKRAYWDAVMGCWRLRKHVLAERRRIRKFRRRGDLWMLRFLRARFNRWDEFQRLRRFGVPKVTAR